MAASRKWLEANRGMTVMDAVTATRATATGEGVDPRHPPPNPAPPLPIARTRIGTRASNASMGVFFYWSCTCEFLSGRVTNNFGTQYHH